MSVGGLVSRVENLIHNRKQFVVTSDYIGPARHDTPGRTDDKSELLEVPNALKTVVTGLPEENAAQAEIHAMIAEINVQKLERYAVDISLPGDDFGAKSQRAEIRRRCGEIVGAAAGHRRRRPPAHGRNQI